MRRALQAVVDALTYDWPAIARGTGLLTGGVQLAVWAVFNRPPDGALLGFSAGLCLVQNVVGVQRSRNTKRSDYDGEDRE